MQTDAFPCSVVCIGASAGGLEAIEELFGHLPADPGMSFVVITHQPRDRKSLLPELLPRDTGMTVLEARDGAQLQPNVVYVTNPTQPLVLRGGRLCRGAEPVSDSDRFPIDRFLLSLAEDQRENAIAVLLSGSGTDGTIGVRQIKSQLGLVMVQDPQTARYPDLPASAIATGSVDMVLAPAEIARKLISIARMRHTMDENAAPGESSVRLSSGQLERIHQVLRKQTGHDFAGYKQSTLQRRIQRRMQLLELEAADSYLAYLDQHSEEQLALFKDLLITVTRFFRDPEAWTALAQHLDAMLVGKDFVGPLRAWVPGCATGEEAYSLAILIMESMERAGRTPEVVIFATDLNADAIEIARAGLFPLRIESDVSADRLEAYFTKEGEYYRVQKRIRDTLIFAEHDVNADPPFTNLHVISCRNLLIYLGHKLQRNLISLFHYSLKPGGLLLLGTSETVGEQVGFFETLDVATRIFRRRVDNGSAEMLRALHGGILAEQSILRRPWLPVVAESSQNLPTLFERALASRFVPPSLIVDRRGNIVYVHGRVGDFFELSEGEANHNAIRMARPGFKGILASALRQCAQSDQAVVLDQVQIEGDVGTFEVCLTVAPVGLSGELSDLFSVSMQTQGIQQSKEVSVDSLGAATRLEREFDLIRQSYQTSLDELEESYDALRASYEHLQAMSEELQSTNEELVTSREETQSLNEELATVNSELAAKVESLSHAGDDLQKLLNAADIATVFLDHELAIISYTDGAKVIFALRPGDIGRPLSELSGQLDSSPLLTACQEVLETNRAQQMDVTTRSGRRHWIRVLPHPVSDDQAAGLVLTFTDITQLGTT